MNILDLNEDIMSKIKHNLFLNSLMKHHKEFNSFINDTLEDWREWEDGKIFDCLSLDNGYWAFSAPRGQDSNRDKYDGESHFKVIFWMKSF